MTPPEEWRRAMHVRDRRRPLRTVAQSLAILAGGLGVLLIAMGVALHGWWGCVPGGLGLAGAVLLWVEV